MSAIQVFAKRLCFVSLHITVAEYSTDIERSGRLLMPLPLHKTTIKFADSSGKLLSDTAETKIKTIIICNESNSFLNDGGSKQVNLEYKHGGFVASHKDYTFLVTNLLARRVHVFAPVNDFRDLEFSAGDTGKNKTENQGTHTVRLEKIGENIKFTVTLSSTYNLDVYRIREQVETINTRLDGCIHTLSKKDELAPGNIRLLLNTGSPCHNIIQFAEEALKLVKEECMLYDCEEVQGKLNMLSEKVQEVERLLSYHNLDKKHFGQKNLPAYTIQIPP